MWLKALHGLVTTSWKKELSRFLCVSLRRTCKNSRPKPLWTSFIVFRQRKHWNLLAPPSAIGLGFRTVRTVISFRLSVYWTFNLSSRRVAQSSGRELFDKHLRKNLSLRIGLHIKELFCAFTNLSICNKYSISYLHIDTFVGMNTNIFERTTICVEHCSI